MNTDKAIATSAIVTVGSTVGFSVAPEKWGGKGEFPHPRLLIGAGLTYLGLSILAAFAPGIAGPLAVTIAVTAFLYYGLPVLDKAFKEKK